MAAEGQPDLLLSSHYACTTCGLSFDPPSPQLFSFNSPQGMCLACEGLGIRHDFAPELLVPDPSLSVWDGAIAPLGPVKDLGRWRRHLFEGVAANLEADADGPAQGHDAEGPVARPEGEMAAGLALRNRRPPDRASLEEPEQDLVACRNVERRRQRSSGQVSRRHRRPGPQSARAVHAQHDLPGLLGLAAEPAGPRRESRRQDPGRAGRHADRRGLPVLRLAVPERSDEPTKTSKRQPKLRNGLKPLGDQDGRSARCGVATVAEELLKEIRARLRFLLDVGLHYLALDRSAPTLSGGEAQRIRLASQVGAGLVGVLYVLDEPSIGLHPRDNDRLLATLQRLAHQGNTVVVVEHDEDTMRAADHLVDFGPGPGVKGGEVIAQGTIDDLARSPRKLDRSLSRRNQGDRDSQEAQGAGRPVPDDQGAHGITI